MHGIPLRHIWYLSAEHLEIPLQKENILPLITSEEQLFRVTDAAIQFFDDHANPGERFKFTIDRIGKEKLYEVLKEAYHG